MVAAGTPDGASTTRRLTRAYSAIWMATGSQPDVRTIECLRPMVRAHAVDQATGLPLLGTQLEWQRGASQHAPADADAHTESPQVSACSIAAPGASSSRFHILGGLACLRLGPDAFNLMGARAASRNVFQRMREYVKRESAAGLLRVGIDCASKSVSPAVAAATLSSNSFSTPPPESPAADLPGSS